MTKKNIININPKILAWAREESGFEIDDIIGVVEVDTHTYQLWEKSGNDIPFSKLKTLAKLFKRQIAIFFLPSVPPKSKRPKDNRNLKELPSKLSPETLLVLRRAGRYCELLNNLNTEFYYKKKYDWLLEFQTSFNNPSKVDLEEITFWIRKKIGISIDDQIQARSQSQIYQMWREAFEEKLGIPSFQFSMPIKEIQGFSLNDIVPYCIVVNNKQSMTGRIFTLFHELGHLLKKRASICFPDNITDNQSIEFECNTFSGMFLIPLKIVQSLNSVDEIFIQSQRLKVSSEAYLRRLKGLDLIDDNHFFKLLAEIRNRVKEPLKPFSRATQVQKSINSRGKHLFNSVIDAANNNRISFGLASDILGIKINNLLSYR